MPGPFPCPACGFEVFPEQPGSYAICPVCAWEDDEVQLRFPGLRLGANKVSLFEQQKQVLPKLPLSTKTHQSFTRTADWRPLTENDFQGHTDLPPSTSGEYFQAIGAVKPRYYWRKK